LQLQLQNLLYQKKHLLQEIQKCAAFQSRHEALGMVDEVEFQAAGPPDADALAGDPHKLMLARIDWELQQRCRFGDTILAICR
jgi:THO complex subunit 5